MDPDAVQQPDKGKKISQRVPRISAWKLAKLDSSEAIKAAEKARASSSVLRPISSQHHGYNADYLSNSSISGKSSPVSTDHGFHNRNARAGTSKLSPSRSSYPPSRASREDSETCHHSISSLSSPQTSNFAPTLLPVQKFSNRDHHNTIYQSSTDQPLHPEKQSKANETVSQIPAKKNNSNTAENMRSSVVWDQEAGRYVSSSSRDAGSSQVAGAELLYTGQSIFFGGPIVNEQQPNRGTKSISSAAAGLDRGSTTYHWGRSQSGGQLPVFVPSDYQQNQFPSRLP